MEEVALVKKNYINYINKLIEYNRISHAYLIEVSKYDVDSKYIYDFIKMIICNCKYQELDASTNKIISLIDKDEYPDIKIIEPDGNWIKKSQLIELKKDYSNKSLFGKKRIYIIKNAEKLNSSSANTILKFLEEPEDDIVAILVTENRYHIIDTILSRCQILSLKSDENISEIDNELISLVEYFAEPKNFFINYNNLINSNIGDKNYFKEKLYLIEQIFINYLNNKYVNDKNDNCNLYVLLDKIYEENIIKYISIIEDEIPKLEFNINYKLWLDSFFSKLVWSCNYD